MGRAEDSADPLVGMLIEHRYLLLARVASGGMGHVYRAEDTRLDRIVAIKVMHRELASDPVLVTRFEREAKAAARLNDPHIVGVFDQGSDGELVWLAMDYVRGFSLRRVIDAHAPLEPDRALGVVEQILSGLTAAHAAGFVHGDVKPENVLMTGEGTMKLTDFGLVRAALSRTVEAGIVGGANTTAGSGGLDSTSDMGEGESGGGQTWSSTDGTEPIRTLTTDTTVLLGTAAYISPEQVIAGVSDQRSDIYATGIVLYELLTGQVPFVGSSALEIANRRIQEDVPSPSAAVPGIPAVVDALVAKATARDPGARFASVSDFLKATGAIEISGDNVDRTDMAGRVEPPMGPDRSMGRPLHGADSCDAAEATTSALGSRDGLAVAGASVATHVYGLAEGRTTILDSPGHPTTALSPGLVEPRCDESEWVPVADPPWASGPIRSASRFGRTKAVVVLVALAAVMAALGWGLGSSGGVALPDVAGQTASEAQMVLAGAGVENTTVTEEFDAATPAGVVLGTAPPPGTVVTRDGGVTLIVSKGPEPVVVPNLMGQSVTEAAASLESLGLAVETRRQLPFVLLNRVVGQDVEAGSSVPPRTTVTLRII